MVGILTTTLTVLAGRDNYNIHIGKRALFTVVTEDCRCHITDLYILSISILHHVCLFVYLFATKGQIVLTCERDSRRDGGGGANLHPGAKTKKRKKIHLCVNCAFLSVIADRFYW